jgi:hypothetical protein
MVRPIYTKERNMEIIKKYGGIDLLQGRFGHLGGEEILLPLS